MRNQQVKQRAKLQTLQIVYSLIFIHKIQSDNNKVIELATTMGQAPISTPYTNHKKTPRLKIKYIQKEIALASLVL
jgi:hypothetical protein